MTSFSNKLLRKPLRPVSYPEGRWLRVAIGDKGDDLYWKEGFEVLEEIRSHLCALEEFGEEKSDLPSQFENLPLWEALSECSFPPLYREGDFNMVTFMKHEESLGWREHRDPGFSAAEVRIYVWSSRRKELLSQARVLASRLAATLEDLQREKAARAPKRKPRINSPAGGQPRLR